jgi:Fur family ferric uptake transcriptional regulator
MENTEELIKKLREKGFRSTKIRELLLMLVVDRHKPLSVAEIRAEMEARGLVANKTTLYRELEFLRKENIVRELRFDGRLLRYELVDESFHCHLICTNCHETECVEMEEVAVPREKANKKFKGFKILEQSLDFFGICNKCQSNGNG